MSVEIKRILSLTATAGGGMDIQRLDGQNPPTPVGAKLSLPPAEWARVQKLLEADLKVANAAAAANTDGADDGSMVVWKP